MKKEISEYMDNVKHRISAKEIDKAFLEMFLIRIKFYQHERLIHLIVTAFISIILVVFIISAYVLTNIAMVTASVILIVLECFYLHHYYFLENHTQLLYDDYNTIYARLKKTRVPAFVKNSSKR